MQAIPGGLAMLMYANQGYGEMARVKETLFKLVQQHNVELRYQMEVYLKF